ncbi:zinc finger protein 277 isoform X3 [Ahaetulla prasina]|uniref:zinc finger protein 277 isoform X3 n=1 Tax=Ahaetulla prasina TaxID=499056 RepID=UPI002647D480|nr:zinc finger protein 277 isoform X3 [Ahaetulla prasina]
MACSPDWAAEGKDHQDYILEPLSLPESPGGISAEEESPSVPCLFCEEYYPISEQNQILKHMIIKHKLIIADVKLIEDFRRYVLYWKKRFTEQPIADFCCIIKTNSEADLEDQDNYFLLCDALPEDRELREKLQQQRLKDILDQQQQERYDADFHGICMFCDQLFLGNSFQCLYCEKIFGDKNKLKDHMRKKQHRKINAKNQEYDRFYIINYLEFGKTWEQVQSEDDQELFHNQEEDWSDWEEHPVCAVCLFCEKQADTTEKLYVHMEEAHGFNLLKIKSEHDLNFYQQIKLMNFIRRQVHQCQCFKCEKKFQLKKELICHLEDSKHIAVLPDKSVWDHPQYYFPTYENDTLLCSLSDNEDELAAEKRTDNIPVISEDVYDIEALKQSSVLNELLHEELNNIET